jgi:GNAT superfamily N-acetyltransferase
MNVSDDQTKPPFRIRSAALADLQTVLHMCQSQELADGGAVFTSADRLANEWKALGDRLAEQVWVVEVADTSFLACVELAREDNVFMLRLWSPPDRYDTGLALALLAHAEKRACTMGRKEGADSVTLFYQATSLHPEAQQALAQSGFALLSTYEKMELALKAPPAPPENISGIEIRQFALGQDAEPVYLADEEAFLDQRGHTPRTFEQWRKRLNFDGETFDPSVWLIAYDGCDLAGAALGEIVQGIGWIHHLFVRRQWRRQGLGAMLMLSVLGSFYRDGVGVARLNVDAQSLTNAHQLYRRLGFRVTGDYSNYEKIVPLA